MKTIQRVILCSTLLWAGMMTGTAAVTGYLKLPDIPGESTDDGHKDWINLLSISHGIVPEKDAASGLPTGKRQHKPISVTKPIDKSTPLLMKSCTDGSVIPIVRLEFVVPGTRTLYYQIILKNVQVPSYQTGGSEGDVIPLDTISLNYEEIKWTYTEFDLVNQPIRDHAYYWNLIQEAGERDELPPGSFRVSGGSSVSPEGDKLMLEWEGFQEFRYIIKASSTAEGTFDPLTTFDPLEDGKQELELPIGRGNQFIQIEKIRQSILQQ